MKLNITHLLRAIGLVALLCVLAFVGRRPLIGSDELKEEKEKSKIGHISRDVLTVDGYTPALFEESMWDPEHRQLIQEHRRAAADRLRENLLSDDFDFDQRKDDLFDRLGFGDDAKGRLGDFMREHSHVDFGDELLQCFESSICDASQLLLSTGDRFVQRFFDHEIERNYTALEELTKRRQEVLNDHYHAHVRGAVKDNRCALGSEHLCHAIGEGTVADEHVAGADVDPAVLRELTRLDEGERLLHLTKWLYESAVVLQPDALEPRLRASLAMLMNGEYTMARAFLHQTVKMHPYNAKAALYLGYAYEGVMDRDQAKKWFEAAKLLGDNSDRFYSLDQGYNTLRVDPNGDDGKKFYPMMLPLLMRLTAFREIMDDLDPNGLHFLTQLQESERTHGRFDSAMDVTKLRENFANLHYIILRGLMSPFEARIYNHYWDSTWYRFKMFQGGSDAYTNFIHSDRLAFWWLCRFMSVVNIIADHTDNGIPAGVRPTYAYLVNYIGHEGSVGLKPHTDAIDNEWTASFHVIDKGWPKGQNDPIYLVTKGRSPTVLGHWEEIKKPGDENVVRADLLVGDCVLFMGRSHSHFREPMGPGLDSGQMIVHYTPSTFPTWKNRGILEKEYAACADKKKCLM